MPFEDVAALRAFPELTIIEPTDEVMLEKLLHQLVDLKGMYYIRCARKAVVRLYDSQEEFEIGKGKELRKGTDVTIIASGIMTAESLKAADVLAEKGISARVVDMFTIKPLDKELVLICEVLAENLPVPVERIGIEDEFGEVGDMEYLKKRFHLTAEDIVKKAEKAIERKSKK